MTLTTARNGLRSFLEFVVFFLMAVLAGVVVVGVVFRKAGASLVWYDEVASILLAWITYYGAALAALHRAHIGVPTLVDHLRGIPRTVIVLVGEACVFVFFGVLAWAGVRVLSVLGGTTLVSLPSVPMSVAQSVIPIGAVLYMVAQLLSLPDALEAPKRIVPPAEAGGPSAGDTTDEERAGSVGGDS
jgi:TRAP-type C4-dicarboxylate transport system permease small subunit